MDSLPLLLVMISAVSHGLWNYLAKAGRDKESFMLLLNITSLTLFLPLFYLILPEIYFPISILPYLIISGVSETLYFLGLGKAYETGDLSLVYPVARSSPVFVTLAAFLFLGENITTPGIIGILVIFIGVYILHLKGLTRQDLSGPLKYLKSSSSRYALLAALGTTIYSITDKLGVTTVDPILYAFWLGFFVTGMLTITIIYRRGFKLIRDELSGNLPRITIAGILMKGGYMMVLYAMSLAQVSYILALRQISVVLGALMGVIFLGEKYGRVRIIGSLIIFIGVYILGALA
ncbi:MAG: GRP family sugar transporter [Candidatus Bathyarchaeota archaeon]